MLKKIFLTLGLLIVLFCFISAGYKHYMYGNCFAMKVSLDQNWETIIINNKYYISEDYIPELATLRNGQKVDKRIYPYLYSMFDDAGKKGFKIYVRSGYRSYTEQKKLWDEQINRLDDQGISIWDAIKQGRLFVQRPGMSEHQTGLAIDINSKDIKNRTRIYNWLKKNSYKYGFVLRYPEDKISITGIGYEPWHFRYVGKKNAEIMYRENLCLEEFRDRR